MIRAVGAPLKSRKLSESELRVAVPAPMLAQLDEAAEANGQTRSALVRLVLRGFLRERYTHAEKLELERP